ncbi:hypothetical protein KSP39_PZI012947 [Platanthera zijinensis]|uniref:Uncharacterized protein n=1 Tax=Platanthera zijinensis TaxID=2320716 RepID=A0AAP0BDH6_9ASPA
MELQESKSDGGQGEAAWDLLVELPVSPGAPTSTSSRAEVFGSGSRGAMLLVWPGSELGQKKQWVWWIRVKPCGGPRGLLFHQLGIGTEIC